MLEIARQMTYCHPRCRVLDAWKNLGRKVKNAGAKGIRILAPIVGIKRKKDDEAAKSKDLTKPSTNANPVGLPQCAYMFDISQTVAALTCPKIHQVSGDPGEKHRAH